MKTIIINILLLSLSLNVFATSEKAIIKANIILGESFVTAKSSDLEIEQVLRKT